MNIKNTILIILISITLNSCITTILISKSIQAGKAKKEFTEENDAIPPNFIGDDEIIIGLLQGRGSYDRYLKSAFKKRYFGKYALISFEEMETNPIFNNKKKYRYIFDYESGNTYSSTYSNGSRSNVTHKRFYVYDRLKEKKFMSGAEFSFFGVALKNYINNLELKRKLEK